MDPEPGWPADSDTKSTPAERVKYLAHEVWRDNQSEMARDWAVSQATISRLLNGVSTPSRRILARIAQHPALNARWLFEGEGEPLLPDRPQPTVGAGVPIALQPLPGDPNDNLPLLTGFSFAVPGELYRTTRYFLEVSPAEIFENSNLVPGDLLLLETVRDVCEDATALWRHICVVRIAEQLCLQRVAVDANGTIHVEHGKVEPELYDFTKMPRRTLIRGAAMDRPTGRPRRTRAARKQQVVTTAVDSTTTGIALVDIKAVAVLMVRRKI